MRTTSIFSRQMTFTLTVKMGSTIPKSVCIIFQTCKPQIHITCLYNNLWLMPSNVIRTLWFLQWTGPAAKQIVFMFSTAGSMFSSWQEGRVVRRKSRRWKIRRMYGPGWHVMQRNSITHTAVAPRNLDAATTLRFADTALQNYYNYAQQRKKLQLQNRISTPKPEKARFLKFFK